MNWFRKICQTEQIYRGEGATSEKGGSYWSPRLEWAAQFTQTGRLDQVISAKINSSDIFEINPLPFGGDPEVIDKAVRLAQENGFKAVRLSEGGNEPPSVFVFDRSALM